MTNIFSSLDRHKPINALTREVNPFDWPRWEPHASVVYFNKLEDGTQTNHYASVLVFPTTAIFAHSSESFDGGLAESSLIGNEGVVGAWLLAGTPLLKTHFLLHTAGFGITVSAEFLIREFAVSSEFRRAILRHASAMVRYATQTCFCYRHHTIEQQVVKMILLTAQRTGSLNIPMTHQMIGNILGVRREGVSEAFKTLRSEQLVEQKRGGILILNSVGLESRACECYHLMRSFLS